MIAPLATCVEQVRVFYDRLLYPKMSDDQLAIVVPGAFASTQNPHCDPECFDRYNDFDINLIRLTSLASPNAVFSVPRRVVFFVIRFYPAFTRHLEVIVTVVVGFSRTGAGHNPRQGATFARADS